MIRLGKILAILAGSIFGLLMAMPLAGQAQGTVSSQKIAQWDDPFTPSQARSRCIRYAKGNWRWGAGWKSCVKWAKDVKKMQCSLYLQLFPPKLAPQEAKKAYLACAATAVADSKKMLIGTPSPRVRLKAQQATGAANNRIKACLRSRGFASLAGGSLRLVPKCAWGPWTLKK